MNKQKMLRTLIREKIKKEMATSFGSVRAGILTLIYAITVGFSRWFILGRNSALNYFLELIIDSFVVGVLFYIGLYLINRFRAPYLVSQDLVIENEGFKNFLESKELDISVVQNSYTKHNEQGDIILYLAVDVINKEKRKIVELDAHLSTIHQYTEEHPDDRSVCNGLSTLYMKRLQWEDGSYQVDLKPGISDLKKLNIAMLNCMRREFEFIHEGKSRIKILPHLQQNALYRIAISFKGKIEGNDYDYKDFGFETEFVCSPQNCISDFLPSAADFPNFPEGLKGKLISQPASWQSI